MHDRAPTTGDVADVALKTEDAQTGARSGETQAVAEDYATDAETGPESSASESCTCSFEGPCEKTSESFGLRAYARAHSKCFELSPSSGLCEYLVGDPWEGAEDVAVQDFQSWILDFQRCSSSQEVRLGTQGRAPQALTEDEAFVKLVRSLAGSQDHAPEQCLRGWGHRCKSKAAENLSGHVCSTDALSTAASLSAPATGEGQRLEGARAKASEKDEAASEGSTLRGWTPRMVQSADFALKPWWSTPAPPVGARCAPLSTASFGPPAIQSKSHLVTSPGCAAQRGSDPLAPGDLIHSAPEFESQRSPP